MDAVAILREQLNNLPVVQDVSIRDRTANEFYMDLVLRHKEKAVIHAVILDRAFPQVVAQTIENVGQENGYLVIIAPYVSPVSAQLLQEHGAGYVDYSGNCVIRMDSVYIRDQGHPNRYAKENRARSVFAPSAHTTSVILRTLLKDVSRVWRIQELATEVGCSIGLVSRIKTYLCEQRWSVFDRDGMKITDARALLQEWSHVYVPPQEIGCYTLDALPEFEKRFAEICTGVNIRACLTGFAGGVRYAPVVRYNKVHVLAHTEDIATLLEATGCKTVESGANIVIYVADAEAFYTDSRIVDGVNVASPVQVYLDCMRLQGRGEEMAEAVFDKEICR